MTIIDFNEEWCEHCQKFIPWKENTWRNPHNCKMKQLHRSQFLKSKKGRKKRGQMSWAEEIKNGLR